MSNVIGLPPPHRPRSIFAGGAAVLVVETAIGALLSANLAGSVGASAGYVILLLFYLILVATIVSIVALARANRQAYFFSSNGVYWFTTFLFDWFDVEEIAVVPNKILEPPVMTSMRGSSSLGYLFMLAVSHQASIAFTMKKGNHVLVHVDPDELSESGRLALLAKLARDRNPEIRVNNAQAGV